MLPKADYYRPDEHARDEMLPRPRMRESERDSPSLGQRYRRRSRSPVRLDSDERTSCRVDQISPALDNRHADVYARREHRNRSRTDSRSPVRRNDDRDERFAKPRAPAVRRDSQYSFTQSDAGLRPTVTEGRNNDGPYFMDRRCSTDRHSKHRNPGAATDVGLLAPDKGALVDIVHIHGGEHEIHATIVDKLGRVWQRTG